MTDTSVFTDNTGRGRYEYKVGNDLVVAAYRKRDDTVYIDHVEAPPALRGTGSAGKLMERIVAHAATHGLTLVPVCGYAVAWLARQAKQNDGDASA